MTRRKIIKLGATAVRARTAARTKNNYTIATIAPEGGAARFPNTEMVKPGRTVYPQLATELHNLCSRTKGVKFKTRFITPASKDVMVHVRVQVSIKGEIIAMEKTGGVEVAKQYLKYIAVQDFYEQAVAAIGAYRNER